MRRQVSGTTALFLAGLWVSPLMAQQVPSRVPAPPIQQQYDEPQTAVELAPDSGFAQTVNLAGGQAPPPPQPGGVGDPNGQAATPMRGREIPLDSEWVVNQNSIERYILPENVEGYYDTPYSTRQEIADVRLVPPVKGGGIANTIILETHDLLGTTNIVLPLLMKDGTKKESRIELLVIDQVSAAYRTYLQNQIKKMFPTSSVDVLILNSQTAVLKGYVEQAQHVAPIENLVRGFLAAGVGTAPDAITVVNTLRFVGAMQVQLRVVMAEVQRSKIRDLGFDADWLNPSGNAWLAALSTATGTFGNRAAGTVITGPAGGIGGAALSSSATGFSNVNFVLRRDGQVAFLGFVRALVTNDLAKILAEPNLVTMSGQPAYFNVGGKVPTLVPQGNGTISVKYQDFGTNLRFVPTVLGNGQIRLDVRPEISQLNNAYAVTINGIQVPGFDTRVAETTVQMEAGQSFVIAGLIQKNIVANAKKLPVLGDIPIAGAVFQNKTYRQVETEILIMVTPHLVDALDQGVCEMPGRESRIPNDIEYYLGSKFEPPCFGDPYRNHIKNWRYNVPDPQPVAVRAYDNYGQATGEEGMTPGMGMQAFPETEALSPDLVNPQLEGSKFVPEEMTEPVLPEPVSPQTNRMPVTPSVETNYEVSYGNHRGGVQGYPAVDEMSLVPPPVAPPVTETVQAPVASPAPAPSVPANPPKQAWRRGTSTWR